MPVLALVWSFYPLEIAFLIRYWQFYRLDNSFFGPFLVISPVKTVFYCLSLLPAATACCCCCLLLLPGATACCYCLLLLPAATAGCYCLLLLPAATPHPFSCWRFFRKAVFLFTFRSRNPMVSVCPIGRGKHLWLQQRGILNACDEASA